MDRWSFALHADRVSDFLTAYINRPESGMLIMLDDDQIDLDNRTYSLEPLTYHAPNIVLANQAELADRTWQGEPVARYITTSAERTYLLPIPPGQVFPIRRFAPGGVAQVGSGSAHRSRTPGEYARAFQEGFGAGVGTPLSGQVHAAASVPGECLPVGIKVVCVVADPDSQAVGIVGDRAILLFAQLAGCAEAAFAQLDPATADVPRPVLRGEPVRSAFVG
jgi:hypothetical protein